jgi:hypothetical protein
VAAIAKKGKAWNDWYARNREEYNAKRKAKYAEDSTHRTAVIERQKDYRKDKPRQPSDGRHFRKIAGHEVEVFRIGYAAEAIGRTIQIIRTWEKEGKIPLPSIPGGHRYYTLNQVKLMTELAELMNEVRYEPKIREHAMQTKTAEIKQKWSN